MVDNFTNDILDKQIFEVLDEKINKPKVNLDDFKDLDVNILSNRNISVDQIPPKIEKVGLEDINMSGGGNFEISSEDEELKMNIFNKTKLYFWLTREANN